MRLYFFEWKKMVKNKITWLVILLSTLAVIGIYLLHLQNTKNVEETIINQYDFLNDLYMDDVEYWKTEKKEALTAKDDELIEEATMMEEHAFNMSETNLLMKQSYLEEDWKMIYQYELENLEPFVHPLPGEVAAYNFEGQPVTDFTLRASYEEIKYKMDHNIQPFIQDTTVGMLFPTVYEDFEGKTLELWEKTRKRYGKQGLYFGYQLVQSMYIPIIILLGCFIFGNTISTETRTKHKHMSFYKVLPIDQSKLFFSKFITGYLNVFVFACIMLAIPMFVGSIVHGWGDFDYPILVYDGYTTEYMQTNAVEDSFHFITLQRYILDTLVLSIGISLLMYSIYFFISQFIKEPIFNVLIVGLLSYAAASQMHPFNPFSYLDTDKVITHEIQLQTWNTGFTYVTGICLNLSLALIFLFINYIVFRYRSN